MQEEHREEFIKKINAPFGDNEIGDTLGEFLERACTQYPWPRGRKSEAWLQEADASQKALDVFWSEMRTIWARKLREEGGVAEHYVSPLTVLRLDFESFTNCCLAIDQRRHRWPYELLSRRKASGRASSPERVCSSSDCACQQADY